MIQCTTNAVDDSASLGLPSASSIIMRSYNVVMSRREACGVSTLGYREVIGDIRLLRMWIIRIGVMRGDEGLGKAH